MGRGGAIPLRSKAAGRDAPYQAAQTNAESGGMLERECGGRDCAVVWISFIGVLNLFKPLKLGSCKIAVTQLMAVIPSW